MSAVITPVVNTRAARYSLLTVELPGQDPMTAGVLLEDPAADRVYMRLRRDWEQVAGEEAEVLAGLEEDLQAKAASAGAAQFFAQLEDTASNAVRVSDRVEAMVEDFPRALGRLYRQHLHSRVRPFVTHLPRYSLAVAAGPFLENRVIDEEVTESGAWEEAPPGLRPAREMFVARIVGRSMEPLIPDGSLCVFRKGVAGSRQGRLVLVEAMDQPASDRYTVKRYRSEKQAANLRADAGPRADVGTRAADAGFDDPAAHEKANRENEDYGEREWAHTRIRLEPLNPAFEAWDLDPQEDRYRILAEFVQVLD